MSGPVDRNRYLIGSSVAYDWSINPVIASLGIGSHLFATRHLFFSGEVIGSFGVRYNLCGNGLHSCNTPDDKVQTLTFDWRLSVGWWF
jgi:hypothetical protein